MPQNPPLRLGTRGSRLALWQAHHVRDLVAGLGDAPPLEIVEIETSGDRIQDVPLSAAGGRDFFTKDIETALIDDRIDFAVHSLKDLATQLPDGLVLASVLERADPRDALVAEPGTTMDSLPEGASIGTSSLRRTAFLRAARPDIRVAGLRGNVPTRVGKLDAGNYDAILLATAGLERLGMGDRIAERLDPDVMTPAPAQGAIGLEARDGDDRTLDVLRRLEHSITRSETDAERALLRTLEGGCSVPIGALGRVAGDRLTLVGRV
ncbi:MAG TPA: hydroxymethylbilane synthase, partial [Myxococcota bacterium]|nr:hydroxymethylbilane synthase [Myxococcota bacterium]